MGHEWKRLVMALIFVSATTLAQDAGEVLGVWEGESICTVHPSPCHDEHVIYEVTKDNAGQLTISADKVVNGERQNMGSLGCTYQKHTLDCAYRDSNWHFVIDGKQMRGTLKLHDGTLFRKISVTRK